MHEDISPGKVTAGTSPLSHQDWNIRLKRVCSVVFCFLVSCTLGFYFSFGNITPYLTSYLRNLTVHSDLSYTDTVWISQAQVATNCVLLPIMGLLSTRISLKIYYTIGFLFSGGSFFGSFLTVQKSFTLTIVTYGVIGAVPLSVFGPSTVSVAAGWMSQGKAGLATGIVLAGWGFGGFAWNQLTTWYINPDNLQPDITVNGDKYFSQPAVLDNVPSCFIVLGCIMTGIQFLSVLLVFQPPAPCPEIQTETTDKSTEISETTRLLPSTDDASLQTVACDFKQTHTDGKSSQSDLGSITQHQYHPKEILKSRVFWTLWLMFFFANLGIMFVLTLFKAYGQTFITNDHFLTLVASCSTILNSASRPMWGILSDKLGYRMVILYAECGLACLVGSFVTCEVTGRVAYFIWVNSMYVCIGGVFTMIPALLLALFGTQYYNVNEGLMDTSGVFSAVANALAVPVLKDTFGWNGVFIAAFCFMFFSVLLTMSLELRCGKTIPPDMYKALDLRISRTH